MSEREEESTEEKSVETPADLPLPGPPVEEPPQDAAGGRSGRSAVERSRLLGTIAAIFKRSR